MTTNNPQDENAKWSGTSAVLEDASKKPHHATLVNGSWNLRMLGSVVVRTPLLNEPPQNESEASSKNSELKTSIAKIRAVIDQAIPRAAIHHASAQLFSKIDSIGGDDPESFKVMQAIYKYAMRMTTRSTPFGMMAGISSGSIKPRTTLVNEIEPYAFARLDGRLVDAISRRMIDSLIGTDGGFRVRLNPTFSDAGNEYTYVFSDRKAHPHRYQQRKVRHLPEIDALYKILGKWTDIEEIIELMISSESWSKDQAISFTVKCLNEQILQTELANVLTTKSAFDELMSRGRRIEKMKQFVKQFDPLKEVLGLHPAGRFAESYAESRETILQVMTSAGVDFDKKDLLHVDLIKSDEGIGLSESVAVRAMSDLSELVPILWSRNHQHEDIARRLATKFGDGVWVSLSTAVDPDRGIQIGPIRRVSSPLLKGAVSGGGFSQDSIEWNAWDLWLVRKICALDALKSQELEISKEDVDKYAFAFDRPQDGYSDTHALHMSLLNESEGGESTVYLRGVYGPSAIALLARFTPGSDAISSQCLKISNQERDSASRQDTVCAEVVHVADPKLLNISGRMPLRDFEIICGDCDSSLGAENQIHVRDMLVCSTGGKIHFFSKRLGKRVLPKLASAHNTGGFNQPIYQMLAAGDQAGGNVSTIRLPVPLSALRYTPRIRYKSLILSLRKWYLDSSDTAPLIEKKKTEEVLIEVDNLRRAHSLPRKISVAEGDNVLDFDLDDQLAALCFAAEVKRRPSLYVVESLDELPGSKDSLAAPHNEIMIPFSIDYGKSDKANAKSISMPSTTNTYDAEHSDDFFILNKWASIEIDIGTAAADDYVANYLSPGLQSLVSSGVAARWFFVRYEREGKFHLRVRAEAVLNTEKLFAATIGLAENSYRMSLVDDVRAHIYKPELERYGGRKGLDICHTIFYGSSLAVATALQVICRADNAEDLRWKFCLQLVVYRVMSAYKTIAAAAVFCKKMRDQYRNEMPAYGAIKAAVSSEYRRREAEVAEVFRGEYCQGLDSILCPEVFEELEALSAELQVEVAPDEYEGVLASTLHMDCNRVFSFDARANEMMIYEYAERYLRSMAARGENLDFSQAARRR